MKFRRITTEAAKVEIDSSERGCVHYYDTLYHHIKLLDKGESVVFEADTETPKDVGNIYRGLFRKIKRDDSEGNIRIARRGNKIYVMKED